MGDKKKMRIEKIVNVVSYASANEPRKAKRDKQLRVWGVFKFLHFDLPKRLEMASWCTTGGHSGEHSYGFSSESWTN